MTDLIMRRGIGAPTRCRWCKAEIVFAETSGGKLAPFERDTKGNYTLENGVAKFVGTPALQLELGAVDSSDRYSSHFASCKQASKWRKEK